MKRWLPLLSLLALAPACGQAAAAGGGAGGTPGQGAGPVQPAPPRATQIRAVSLRAGVDDSGGYARVGWWGGLPSCEGVASSVGRHGGVIVVTLTATDPAAPGTACPAIAMRRTTTVQLGTLPPGSYTVRAGGRRAQLVVS